MMNTFRSACILALLALPVAAGATPLTGDLVGIRYVGVGDTGVQSYIVGPGEEGNFFGNQFFDFGEYSFAIRSTGNYCGVWACAGPISLELSSLDFGAPISGVTFATNLTGVVANFGANFVTFSWSEQNLTPSTYLTAQFQAVPEPTTLALFALGSVGVAAVRRRRRA